MHGAVDDRQGFMEQGHADTCTLPCTSRVTQCPRQLSDHSSHRPFTNRSVRLQANEAKEHSNDEETNEEPGDGAFDVGKLKGKLAKRPPKGVGAAKKEKDKAAKKDKDKEKADPKKSKKVSRHPMHKACGSPVDCQGDITSGCLGRAQDPQPTVQPVQWSWTLQGLSLMSEPNS